MDLLAHMRTFARIVERGSLSGAAREARIALPTVSRQLRALEEHLGVALLVRSTRRMHLTDAGRRFYERSVRILGEVDAVEESIDDGRVARGTLVVSASITLGLTYVLPRLPALSQAHPKLEVELRLEDRYVDLVAEGVDVAIRGGGAPPDSTAFVAHLLFESTRVVVASPRYLRKHGTPRAPEQLVRHTCLVQLAATGSFVRWTLRKGDDERTVPVRGALRTNAPVAIRDLARAGAGVALLPDWVVADDLASGALVRVLAGWEHPRVQIWAFHRSELRGSRRLRVFVDAMKP